VEEKRYMEYSVYRVVCSIVQYFRIFNVRWPAKMSLLVKDVWMLDYFFQAAEIAGDCQIKYRLASTLVSKNSPDGEFQRIQVPAKMPAGNIKALKAKAPCFAWDLSGSRDLHPVRDILT
jgi:hypothetical protein